MTSLISNKPHGRFVQHEPCPKCGSRNNLARYEDGYAVCFSFGCDHWEKGDGTGVKVVKMKHNDTPFVEGTYKSLDKRGLSEDSCRKWGYQVGQARHPETKELTPCQIANYYDEKGELKGQKLRFPDKSFSVVGKLPGFYGKHLWTTGKKLVITEGEIDALSVSQIQEHKWPVVSLPNGAQSAVATIKRELKWLEDNFEEIILMFDNDEPGIKAAEEVAQLFSPNKCKIAKLSEKDANEMLLKNKSGEIVSAIFRAKTYRPEVIVPGSELWDILNNTEIRTDAHYPFQAVDAITKGLRLGELVTVCAGSGIGKSQFCREIAYKLIQSGETLGYIALEESVQRTALGLMSIEANKPLHITRDGVTPQVLEEVYRNTVGKPNAIYFYNDFAGQKTSSNLLSNIRYLVKGCDVKWIILDHISIVISGMEGGEERRLIDNLMTDLRSLVQELQIGMIVVSHLKRPEGKGHEEGAHTSLAQLRGSAAIAQLSNIVIGLERDQQSNNNADLTTVRILKNRYTGETGVVGHLKYYRNTGRLLQTDDIPSGTLELQENDY